MFPADKYIRSLDSYEKSVITWTSNCIQFHALNDKIEIRKTCGNIILSSLCSMNMSLQNGFLWEWFDLGIDHCSWPYCIYFDYNHKGYHASAVFRTRCLLESFHRLLSLPSLDRVSLSFYSSVLWFSDVCRRREGWRGIFVNRKSVLEPVISISNSLCQPASFIGPARECHRFPFFLSFFF